MAGMALEQARQVTLTLFVSYPLVFSSTRDTIDTILPVRARGGGRGASLGLGARMLLRKEDFTSGP